MNLVPFVLWAFLAGLGYIVGGSYCALVGLVIGLGVSLLATLLTDR